MSAEQRYSNVRIPASGSLPIFRRDVSLAVFHVLPILHNPDVGIIRTRRVVRMWNELSEEALESDTIMDFKRHFNRYMGRLWTKCRQMEQGQYE